MRSGRRRLLLLAAIVIALAVGVVAGVKMLPTPIASGLRADNDYLKARIAALTDENTALAEKLAASDQFGARMSGRILSDALLGKSVVLFRTPDAEDADVDAVAAMVGQAAGTVAGTIALTSEFVDANSAEKLRSVVNSPIVPAGAQLDTALADPSAQAGDLLGAALLINRDPMVVPAADYERYTVLTALGDTGFLTYDDSVGPADTAVVVTGGGLAEDAGNQGVTVARFAAGLVPRGSGVVLAGRDGSATGVSALAVVRGDPELGGAVTTVDDVGTESGRLTTVLALQSLIAGAPAGRYGVGDGAASVTVQ